MDSSNTLSPLFALPPEPQFAFDPDDLGPTEVLMVDDDESAILLGSSILERAGFEVRTFLDPRDALNAVQAGRQAVLVSDVQMPGLTGLELAERAQEVDPDLPVILLTGEGDEKTAQQALRQGVSDYLLKPPNAEELSAAVQRAVQRRLRETYHREMLAWMKEELARRGTVIRELTVSALSSLVAAMDARNEFFVGHSRSVSLQAAAVAATLGLDDDEIESIRTAALLHDLGMIGVPDSVIDKAGALTPQEYDLIKGHPTRGADILKPMSQLNGALQYVREHHERWDGSGYPDGLAGHAISLGGQILAVSEAWTGIIESRAYRPGHSREEASQIMRDARGTWFSKEMVDALLESDLGVVAASRSGGPEAGEYRDEPMVQASPAAANSVEARTDGGVLRLSCGECGSQVFLREPRWTEGGSLTVQASCPVCQRTEEFGLDPGAWMHLMLREGQGPAPGTI